MNAAKTFCFTLIVLVATGLGQSINCQAQLINVSSPFVTTSDSFYENFGVGFGFGFPAARGNGSRIVGLGPGGRLTPNVRFRQNNQAIPPFGGFSPAAGAQFGFQRVGARGGGFGLGLNFAQGNTRTNVTQAPYVTMMNGGNGFISSGGFRPFVTGVVPIVGRGQIDNGVTRAINSGQLDLSKPSPYRDASKKAEKRSVLFGSAKSSATHGDMSVSRIKAERSQRLQAVTDKVNEIIKEGDGLVEEGNLVAARSRYRTALKVTKEKHLLDRVKAKLKAAR